LCASLRVMRMTESVIAAMETQGRLERTARIVGSGPQG
jgi:hypothetical protein